MSFKFYLKYDDEIIAEGTDEEAIQEYMVSLLQEKREESQNHYLSRYESVKAHEENKEYIIQLVAESTDRAMNREKQKYKIIKVPIFNKGE